MGMTHGSSSGGFYAKQQTLTCAPDDGALNLIVVSIMNRKALSSCGNARTEPNSSETQECVDRKHELIFSLAIIPGPCTEGVLIPHLGAYRDQFVKSVSHSSRPACHGGCKAGPLTLEIDDVVDRT